jgi:hypothetical protein
MNIIEDNGKTTSMSPKITSISCFNIRKIAKKYQISLMISKSILRKIHNVNSMRGMSTFNIYNVFIHKTIFKIFSL